MENRGGEARPKPLREGGEAYIRGQWLHPSHKIKWYRGVTYCNECGKYATKKPGALTEGCLLKPQSKTAAEGLKRIHRGMFPKTGQEWPKGEDEAPPEHIRRLIMANNEQE